MTQQAMPFMPAGIAEARYAGVVVVLPPELWARLEAEARTSGRSPASELTLAVQIHCGLVDPAVRFPQLEPERMQQAARHVEEGKLTPLTEVMDRLRQESHP